MLCCRVRVGRPLGERVRVLPPEGCMSKGRVWFGAASAWLVLAVTGCPNPNTYTTPRTLDRGTVQSQVAVEGIGVDYKARYGSTDSNANPIKTDVLAGLPVFPTFGVRFGAAEGLEIGLRLPNGEPFAADAKIRLLKGPVDVALDPGLQLYLGSANGNSFAALNLQAPALLGFNFSRDYSLVLSPGLAYAQNTATNVYATGVAGSSTAAGFMARLGIGFDYRVSRRLAIHPEVTLMRQFTGSEDLLLCVGGIGFNFGAQPDYSDLASSKPSEMEPPTSSPPPAEPEAPPAPSVEPPASAPATDVKL
jgi:hypothetical protein